MAIEVAKHGVTAPMAKDSDFIRINTTEEEGHGATGSEGPSRNVFRIDPSIARMVSAAACRRLVIMVLDTAFFR